MRLQRLGLFDQRTDPIDPRAVLDAPADGIDAVQLELAQSTYLDEATGAWDDARAAAVTPLLRALLRAALG